MGESGPWGRGVKRDRALPSDRIQEVVTLPDQAANATAARGRRDLDFDPAVFSHVTPLADRAIRTLRTYTDGTGLNLVGRRRYSQKPIAVHGQPILSIVPVRPALGPR